MTVELHVQETRHFFRAYYTCRWEAVQAGRSLPPVITAAFVGGIKNKIAAYFLPTVFLLPGFYCSGFSASIFLLSAPAFLSHTHTIFSLFIILPLSPSSRLSLTLFSLPPVTLSPTQKQSSVETLLLVPVTQLL